MRQHRTLVLAIGVFVVVLISMQLYLLMIGLEALLTYDAGLAWTAAITSVALGAVSVLLYRYLRHPSTTAPRIGTRRPRATTPGSRVARAPEAGQATGTGPSSSAQTHPPRDP